MRTNELNKINTCGPAAGPGHRGCNFEAMKSEVFGEFQPVLARNEHLLRLSLVEAEALARQTEYPCLVFPLLATEKAQKAARWQSRQRYLLRANEQALAA